MFGHADDDYSEPEAFAISPIRPLAPLTATTAESLNDGLYKVPQVAQFTKLEEDASEGCLLSSRHFDRDGCTTNDKFVAYKLKELDTMEST